MLRLKTRVFTTIVVASNVLGNFFLSRGMKAHGSALSDSVGEYISVLFSPWVSAGILLLILWLLSRLALLSWADLSYVLPVTAIGYVLNAVMGRVFLNEQVTLLRWGGTLLIFAGIVLVGRTSIQTHRGQGETR